MARVASHTPHRPPVQQPALVDAEQCCLLPFKPFLTSNDVNELTVYEQTKQRGASMTQLEWTGKCHKAQCTSSVPAKQVRLLGVGAVRTAGQVSLA